MTGHIGGRPLAAPTVTWLAGLTLLVIAATTGLYSYYQSKIAHVRLEARLI